MGFAPAMIGFREEFLLYNASRTHPIQYNWTTGLLEWSQMEGPELQGPPPNVLQTCQTTHEHCILHTLSGIQ
jgi:hypothetical protein